MADRASTAIPEVDVGPLFGAESSQRDDVDARILSAASNEGFLTITGLPRDVPRGVSSRAALLRIFELSPSERRLLWRQKFEPKNPNVYRGWFPVQSGNVTSKEGIDLGGDVAHGDRLVMPDDPLRERTPLPQESRLPGWHRDCADYYLAMERVSQALMHSLARGLRLPESYFDASFRDGLSTLRLLVYPVRPDAELSTCRDPQVWADVGGDRRYVTGAAHTDSGFLTLVAQDGVGGLQARGPTGAWIDVPPNSDALVVNFGQLLERWTAGRIRATEHRVVGTGAARHSVPFFYEARADAVIRPLPWDPPDAFEPLVFGDYLWSRITQFVEFRGMGALRTPTAPTG